MKLAEDKQMACGGCGCGSFNIYKHDGMIFVVCKFCNDVSVIRATAALKIDWGDEHGHKAVGRLCVMTPNDK